MPRHRRAIDTPPGGESAPAGADRAAAMTAANGMLLLSARHAAAKAAADDPVTRIDRSLITGSGPSGSMGGLTPDVLGAYLQDWYAGRWANIVRTWHVMERRDDVVAPVREKRLGKVLKYVKGWDILEIPDDDAPAAERTRAGEHAAFLREFYNNLRAESAIEPEVHGGMTKFAEFALDAVGKQYSLLGKAWERRGGSWRLTVRHAPLWFFGRNSDKGILEFYPAADSLNGEPVATDEWIIAARSRAVMEAASVLVLFKRLPQHQLVRILEKWGIPNVYGKTSAEPNSPAWNALYNAVSAYISDMVAVIGGDGELKASDQKISAATLHAPWIQWCSDAISINWLGGSLGTFATPGTGTLAGGAQAADTDDMIGADCDWLSELCQEQIDRDAIRLEFGDDEPLAYLAISKPDAKDQKLTLQVIAAGLNAGLADIPQTWFHEEFGIPTAKPGGPVLALTNPYAALTGGAAGGKVEPDPSAAAANSAPRRSRLARLSLHALGRIPGANYPPPLCRCGCGGPAPTPPAGEMIPPAPPRTRAATGPAAAAGVNGAAVSGHAAGPVAARLPSDVRPHAGQEKEWGAGAPCVPAGATGQSPVLPAALHALRAGTVRRQQAVDAAVADALPAVRRTYAALWAPLIAELGAVAQPAAARNIVANYRPPAKARTAYVNALVDGIMVPALTIGFTPARPDIRTARGAAPATPAGGMIPPAPPRAHAGQPAAHSVVGRMLSGVAGLFRTGEPAGAEKRNEGSGESATPRPGSGAGSPGAPAPLAVHAVSYAPPPIPYADAKALGFQVAGITDDVVLAEIWDLVEDLVDGVYTVDTLAAKLAADYGLGSWHAETIARQNAQNVYGWANYKQLTDPAVQAAFPDWLFDAVIDAGTTEVCERLNGRVYAANDPFWGDYYPPLHFNCRSTVTPLSGPADYAAFGGVPGAGLPMTNPATGAPLVPGAGFGGFGKFAQPLGNLYGNV